jgi:hypothetical protein
LSLSQTLELPVVVTAATPEGTGYVGDRKQLAIWIRDVEFFVSLPHSGCFTLNISAALAEIWAAVGMLAPAAFCRCTTL